MKLTFLSTGYGMNSENTGPSLLVNDNILIDAPPRTLQALCKYGGSVSKLDTIILTQLDGEQVFGLPFLLAEFRQKPRCTVLTILAPFGAREFINELMKEAFPETEPTTLMNPAKPLFISNTDGQQIKTNEILISSHKLVQEKRDTYGFELYQPGGKRILYGPHLSYSNHLQKILETIDIAIIDTTHPIMSRLPHPAMDGIFDLSQRFPGKLFFSMAPENYQPPPSAPHFPTNRIEPAAGSRFSF